MKPERSLTATYRLQLNGDQTFRDARELVDYLDALGVSHVYSSPCLMTRKGSPHGYDIIDHNRLNPELGGEEAFNALVDALHARDMGLIMDIVPNHMGVGSDNAWWMDVLENGEASLYSHYFDIDWRPNNRMLQNKLLLPFLGDHYGLVLERGELKLVLNEEEGAFHIAYFDHRFPVDPRTWGLFLGPLAAELQNGGGEEGGVAGLRALLAQLHALPRRTSTTQARKRLRAQLVAESKADLASLLRGDAELRAHLVALLEAINGKPGVNASFERLHKLLEAQAYRLSYWKVAADEINYRRFFDVNDLAGLRMEDPEVFDVTHRLIARLTAQGRIDGVRVDHVDGLSDPSAYCLKLRHLLDGERGAGHYIYLEKILAQGEELHPAWPVDGTTGYEFGAAVNGLFVQASGQSSLSLLYNRFAIPAQRRTGTVGRDVTGVSVDFDELVYTSKKVIIQHALSGELTVLVNMLNRLAQAERHTRDFTYNSLRSALTEVVACFPVYRTYITSYRYSESDRHYVQLAVDEAQRRNPGLIMQFAFIHDILAASPFARPEVPRTPDMVRLVNGFCLRFQQYTSMVEAKGLEDTACYRFNRLTSLNEVGFDPCTFGCTPDEFHAQNLRRLETWPRAMLSTSTHDSKRGEDVRTRIDVITEAAGEWKLHVLFWKRLNRQAKRRRNGRVIPSGNDEYLLYQTLLGAWPTEDEVDLEDFRQRIENYMLKAVREAKVHTSWAIPSQEYEEGLTAFIRALLADGENAFLADFLPFQRRLARFGLLNSLSQVALKLCSPGVPDIYQGNELFAYNLVDPDNRRPVDFDRARRLLDEVRAAWAGPAAGLGEQWAPDTRLQSLREWLDHIEDGRAKLFLTWRLLQLRRSEPALFSAADYEPLDVAGSRADHIVAFARRHNGRTLIVATARGFTQLHEHGYPPNDTNTWTDTLLEAPEGTENHHFHNLLTGNPVPIVEHESRKGFEVQTLLGDFPVAVLLSQ